MVAFTLEITRACSAGIESSAVTNTGSSYSWKTLRSSSGSSVLLSPRSSTARERRPRRRRSRASWGFRFSSMTRIRADIASAYRRLALVKPRPRTLMPPATISPRREPRRVRRDNPVRGKYARLRSRPAVPPSRRQSAGRGSWVGRLDDPDSPRCAGGREDAERPSLRAEEGRRSSTDPSPRREVAASRVCRGHTAPDQPLRTPHLQKSRAARASKANRSRSGLGVRRSSL
jgi:hypothetical protein